MFFAVIGQALCGWLIADFVGGMFHWWEDRVGNEKMPGIGRWVVSPNRLHHIDAMAFLKKPFLVRNWTALPIVIAISLVWLWLLGPSVIWVTASIGAAISVEVHYQSHLPHERGTRLRSLLRPLWDIGLIQSPAVHNRHHLLPDGDYCPLTGWLNPILEHINFWSFLEDALTIIGLEPNRGTA